MQEHRRIAALSLLWAVVPCALVAQQERADTTGRAQAIPDEAWKDITPERVSPARMTLPVADDMEGPSVVAAQVLLDQNRFSPGVIDGYWGQNTEKAVYWYENRHGLSADGELDRTTMEHLLERGGERPLVRRHTLSQDDVSGPFRALPEDIYARADMECLCYESLAEKLGERFHASPALLRKLNPDVDLNALEAGDELVAPNVSSQPEAVAGAGAEAGSDAGSGAAAETGSEAGAEPDAGARTRGGAPVAEILVSDDGRYLHARDADGRTLYHFPAVLGADYAPSPTGNYTVTSITFDPTWHYQPDLLSGVDPSRPDAVLPPGPNNAVGVVWMQLSTPHYGIHGTGAPSTVGYTDSHGCVRLTNWDAAYLAHRIEEGVPVRFQDTAGRAADGLSAPGRSGRPLRDASQVPLP